MIYKFQNCKDKDSKNNKTNTYYELLDIHTEIIKTTETLENVITLFDNEEKTAGIETCLTALKADSQKLKSINNDLEILLK